MKRLFALLALAACGGGTEPHKAVVDPAISIHLSNQLDTTTAMGRASWVIFPLIYAADTNKAGVDYKGAITLGDLRLGHSSKCLGYQADSIGARFVVVLAVADTLHGTQADAQAQSVATAWYGGDHTLPAGWAAIATDSLDWGISTQFSQGHGLNFDDPVRWDLTWTDVGTVARVEAPNDHTCQ